jgi:hypothetical protein
MASEIVPQEQMGRWFGLIGLVRGLVSVPAPLLGGLIWEHIAPQYVFIFAVVVDAALRLPLLASIRETLDLSDSDKDGGQNSGSDISPAGFPEDIPNPGGEDPCRMQ